MEPTTIVHLLEKRVAENPEKQCIVSPEAGSEISYVDLLSAIERVARSLCALGVGNGDRIAILLPNSAEFAMAYFAAMAVGGIAVPINPALKVTEMEGILRHSGARAMVVGKGAAMAAGVRSELMAAGEYELTCFRLAEAAPRDNADVRPGDALMMYTSGTTGQPKGVIIQHRNLLASVQNVTSTCNLSEGDVALCVLPLTHIHGLIAAMVSTLCSGGTLVLPRRFDATRFWHTVQRHGVTWFTAVPTIFTILLQRAASNSLPRRTTLRFARSASAPLPVAVLNGFESLVGCPVVEAYGLTEATHQAASNPLPPGQRRWGSAGVPTGTEVAVMDENGALLGTGEEGELALRGESITRGYFEDEAANAEAFLGPWFRTGDLGRLDADGYVYITGRKKEQINRAGQKISPREVDEALYRHPKVAEAAAVGVPHPLYGEEVEAFVVLRHGEESSEREIREHCALYLADYKCPKAVRFVSALPKSANGKVQRTRLLEVRQRDGQEG